MTTQKLSWTPASHDDPRKPGDPIGATLTTDHPASSYGVPVLLYEGQVLGVDDTMVGPGWTMPADEYVTYAHYEATGDITPTGLTDAFLAAR